MIIYNVWAGEYGDSEIVKSFKDMQSAEDFCTIHSLTDESYRVLPQEVSDEKYKAPDYFWVKSAAWKTEWREDGIQVESQDIFTQKELEDEFAKMWDVNVNEKNYEAQVPPLEIDKITDKHVKIVKQLKYNEFFIYVKISKNSFFDKDISNLRAELHRLTKSIAKCLYGEKKC
jgi:hypothetical protein